MIVVLLLGAGVELPSNTRKKLKNAIDEILDSSTQYESPLQSLKFFAEQLENCPYTNAGTGSELNQNGEIECDSCVIVHGTKLQSASVAAVSNVLNPTLICTSMLEDSSRKGLSAPRFLAGNGAYEYSKTKEHLKLGTLETERSRNAYQYWTERHQITDTIGVIVVDKCSWAACSSSGGSLLKFPGRVGPAAVPGAAVDVSSESAAVCSGFGEDILISSLARQSNSIDNLEHLPAAMSTYELQRSPYFGVVRAQRDSKAIYIEYFHTTEAMTFCVFDTETKERQYTYSYGGGIGGNGGGYRFSL